MSPTEKQKILHAWRSIGLVIDHHKHCLTSNDKLLCMLASRALGAVAGLEEDDAQDEWPETITEQWNSLK